MSGDGVTEGAPVLHLARLNVVDVARIEGVDARRSSSVTIERGRVTGIGGRPPPGALVLDLTGCWATPGLVDMHAHVTFDARAHDPLMSFDFDEPAPVGAMRAVQNLTDALRNGICLVRDTGGRNGPLALARRALTSGAIRGPELVTCGEPLCLPGGHGWAFGQPCADVSDLPAIVAAQKELGHEWVKVMHGPELWPASDLAGIVKAAHAEDLKVAVHAFTPEGIESAVRSGADTVEHALLGENLGQVVEEARAHGTVFVPTFYCSWLSLRPRFTWTQAPVELGHLEFWRDLLEGSYRHHLDCGLPVLPGTDAGCAPCSFDDYVDELAQFQRWGLSPADVIRAATLDAAAALGRAGDFGSIDVGKWANLVVTEESPLASVKALRTPVLVLFKGADVLNRLGERWS